MEINLNYEQLNAEYSMLMSVLGASDGRVNRKVIKFTALQKSL